MGNKSKVAGLTLAAGFIGVATVGGLQPLGSDVDNRLGLAQHIDDETIEVVERRFAAIDPEAPLLEIVTETTAVHFDRVGTRAVAAGQQIADVTVAAYNGAVSWGADLVNQDDVPAVAPAVGTTESPAAFVEPAAGENSGVTTPAVDDATVAPAVPVLPPAPSAE